MTWEYRGSIDMEGTEGRSYASGGLQVLVSRDPPDARWHISISHQQRYPTWDEIKRARYDLVPDEVTMAMLLPPKSQYVNVHDNCFHLHEWRDSELVFLGPK